MARPKGLEPLTLSSAYRYGFLRRLPKVGSRLPVWTLS